MEFDWPNNLPEPIKFHVTFRIQNSRHYERGLLLGTLRSTTRSARRRALKERHLSYKTKTTNNL